MSKKINTNIKPHQAELLGLRVNKSGQYRIDKDMYNTLVQIRLAEKTGTAKISTTETATNEYFTGVDGLPSAWNNEAGRFYSISEYCDRYNIDYTSVSSYKLVAHNSGHMVYNIAMKANHTKEDFNALTELEKALSNLPKFKRPKKKKKRPRSGVVTLADLHFGALVTNSQINPDYSPEILATMLFKASQRVNNLNYDIVHVHLLGDLIESFTGLMHKNQWKQIAPDHYGVKVVKLFVEAFKTHFLDNLNNLGKIKCVGGNHDRTTSDKTEDVEGGAADLAIWGLKLLGYDVEFSPSVLTHTVDDITYILNHGHHMLTKKLTTNEMCWRYGVKGNYNFVCEGHLHSRIKKMTASRVQAFRLVQDDGLDSRRMVFPSLFTGNTYSEQGGWTTTAGFIVTESNGNKKPIVYDFPL
jgi:hypothetical protein